MKEKKLVREFLWQVPENEYNKLKEMGFLWEFWPEATGDWAFDVQRSLDQERDD